MSEFWIIGVFTGVFERITARNGATRPTKSESFAEAETSRFLRFYGFFGEGQADKRRFLWKLSIFFN